MKNTKDRPYRYVVGIGASAGGLEALQKLLSSLSPGTGFPYIIVQHLSPDYKSLITEILSKYTQMPVAQAEDGVEIEPDHVYIIQPGKLMTIKQGRLHLSDQIPHELNLPIDTFFRSLAEEARGRAIAIVLSGTGSDGSNGIRAVKENDGLVIVQDLSTSKFDGMPRSAMRTGLVDAQISPEEIALELEHIAGASIDPSREDEEHELDAGLVRRVYSILRKYSNVNFTHYKQTTIIRRMERRMMLTHRDTLPEYLELLSADPEEVRTLSREVLIGVTSFFRDPEYFQRLKDEAISEIINRGTADEPIRVWVAGCSTGEEAYSIAILFCEALEALKLRRVVKIFATDLDVESINVAGKGVYGENIADAVSAARLTRYFTRRNGTYTVNRDVRKMIVFSPHNVFQDPPFGRLDLISCRNMLIYFQTVLQNDLFAIFHQALKDGGYLFLGKSEAIGTYADAFPVVDAAAKIFSHRSGVRIEGAKKIPYLQTGYPDDGYASAGDMNYPHPGGGSEGNRPESDAIDMRLLERFMPASVVVNERNELVHSFGKSANFIHLALGRYSNNLFDVITEGLKIPVSTLLKEAREKNAEVCYQGIRFTGELCDATIDLTILPVSTLKKGVEGLYALVFDERGEAIADAGERKPYDLEKVAATRITDLEQELSATQERLASSVAEQEVVNEELQSANEELLTANEELQSSNEELQSVNEELYSVNSEYQQKMAELNDLNDDIANFLTSTLIGIIFVDNKLNIRRYTDYVTTEFSVMDHDIGRSLAFISYHFPAVDITEICTGVLRTLIPDEREIATNRDKVFFMRVAPYRSTENKIMGCVITLMDITKQKHGQETLQSTEKRLSIVEQANEAKTDYLSRIAYEIRTPMTALISLAKDAKRNAGDGAKRDVELDKIIDTVEYMTAIVTDLSEASANERLTGEQQDEAFTLRSLLDSVSAMMEPRAMSAGLRFSATMDEGLSPAYFGNRMKVQKVLVNFINYAVKRTPAGGKVELRAFEEPAAGRRACLCLRLSDTGAAISPDDLPKLFKPFAASEDKAHITAELGLSIAYNIVDTMGGDVSIDESDGTFVIHVMLDRADKQAVPDEPVPVAYDLLGCHVLIAEDNALNRMILDALLANEGITYDDAVNGEEALNAFRDSPVGFYGCILMDMRMPKLDGIRATAAIRALDRPDAKTIPIIAVSSNGFSDDIRQAQSAGVNEYVTKPIDRDALLTAMTRLVKK